jgi:hypothetical protein
VASALPVTRRTKPRQVIRATNPVFDFPIDEQIRELRLTLPGDYNLSADVFVALGPTARRWLEEQSEQYGHGDWAATAHTAKQEIK